MQCLASLCCAYCDFSVVAREYIGCGPAFLHVLAVFEVSTCPSKGLRTNEGGTQMHQVKSKHPMMPENTWLNTQTDKRLLKSLKQNPKPPIPTPSGRKHFIPRSKVWSKADSKHWISFKDRSSNSTCWERHREVSCWPTSFFHRLNSLVVGTFWKIWDSDFAAPSVQWLKVHDLGPYPAVKTENQLSIYALRAVLRSLQQPRPDWTQRWYPKSMETPFVSTTKWEWK